MSYEQKQEHTDAILDGLKRGPVECEVSNSGNDGDWVKEKILGYFADHQFGFVAAEDSMHLWFHFARPIPPKKRVPWTPEEILCHGVFYIHGRIAVVFSTTNETVDCGAGQWRMDAFMNQARAVVRETLPSGQVVDTGGRLELWKEVEGE